MHEDTEQRLQQAYDLIRAGRKGDALPLLRSVCAEQPKNPAAWWLVAHAVTEETHKRAALERVLALQPDHPGALKRMAALKAKDSAAAPKSEFVALPSPVGEDGELIAPVPRRKAKAPPSRSLRRLILSIAAAAAVLVCGVVVAQTQFRLPPLPQPMVGPYYPRYQSFADSTQQNYPCAAWYLLGRVDDGAGEALDGVQGVTIRAWTQDRRIERTAVTDSRGEYVLEFPRGSLHTPQSTSTTETGLLRLFDAAGEPLSGNVQWTFIQSCVLFFGFERYAGPANGTMAFRPAVHPGPYIASYSSPTRFEPFGCDFTGFVGTVHDDHGPVNGMIIEFWNDAERKMFYNFSGEDPRLGDGGWSIPLEAGKTYVLNVRNPDGAPTLTQIMTLPDSEGDCNRQTRMVALTQVGLPSEAVVEDFNGGARKRTADTGEAHPG